MTKRKKANGYARPVRTKRDYERAASVAKRLSSQADRDSAAELRLQSLLRQLDKFDDLEDEAGADDPADYPPSGPRRPWSDNQCRDNRRFIPACGPSRFSSLRGFRSAPG